MGFVLKAGRHQWFLNIAPAGPGSRVAVYIGRPPAPPQFYTTVAPAERALRAFLAKPEAERYQQRPPWDLVRNREFLDALLLVYPPKCAYCETPIGSGAVVSLFCPRSLYPELATSWQNLLLSCFTCNSVKRDLFPTHPSDESQPRQILGRGEAPTPVLIDPSADRPEFFLTITLEGQ